MHEDEDDQDEEWYAKGPGFGQWTIPIYEDGKIQKALEPRANFKTTKFQTEELYGTKEKR